MRASGKDVVGTSTDIGSGSRNTQLIVEFLRLSNENERAAQLVSQLNINSFTDWFLPSKDELYFMYRNLHLNGLGEWLRRFSCR